MFNIFKSNRLEILVQALAAVIKNGSENPLSPEWIGIQSKGMKQWISLQLAGTLGICSNIRFVFPRQMVDAILASALPQQGQEETLNEDLLFWVIMKLIHENRFEKEMTGIESYLKGDDTGNKLFQLSMKLARVFDEYQVYRPDMLMDWQMSAVASKDPETRWQAFLWKKLVSKIPEQHLAHNARLFLDTRSSGTANASALPARMSLFGLSSLPEIFLRIFEKVSDEVDIHLFLLAPSNQFFLDTKSKKQVEKMALKDAGRMDTDLSYYEMTHPLLSSMGTSGIRFHTCLETVNYHEPLDNLFMDPLNESNTLLSHLQSDILNLVNRKKGFPDSPVAVLDADASVSIHACHSPMREAQVLKDLLIDAFEKDPDLLPHDIIVMMPDIEAYAPYIESVFALETPLPFSISDRRKRSESEPLEAFLKILALKGSRMDYSMVLDLLLSPSIAQKFNISIEMIPMIEKMVEDAHILWGRDAEHRQALGLPAFEENTWQFGLQRLFMGMAMPEDHDEPVQTILPCPSFEGLDLDVLGKLADFSHVLFSCLDSLGHPHPIDGWSETLTRVWVSLLDQNFNTSQDLAFLSQTIDQLREDAKKAGFSARVSFEVIHAYMEQKLDSNISQGSFLTGNITFCNLKPMRSIPFKMIALMGMDEKSFPRKTFSPGFNLIKKYPRLYDKSERNEDRYLFLETLLSARDRVVITYTGMSIQDNSKIPCAGVVSELMDVLNQSFVFQKGSFPHFFHPLHPFNKVYFNGSTRFFSYSGDNCKIATALDQDSIDPDTIGPATDTLDKKHERMDGSLISGNLEPDGEPSVLSAISLDDMIRFFKKPVEMYVKQVLNIQFPEIEEQARDREAFSVSGLDQYILGNRLIEKKMAHDPTTDLYPVFKAMGSLPFGEKGRLEYERLIKTAGPIIDKAKIIASKNQLPAIVKDIAIADLTVSVNFSEIREDGLYAVGFGKLTPARLLSGWIRHVFLNICAPTDYPKETILIGQDPKGKVPFLKCIFPALGSEAKAVAEQLTLLFQSGHTSPLYFFCNTSFQFANALSRHGYALTMEAVSEAMHKSRSSWYGGYFITGEKENRYVSLYVEKNDPFESVENSLKSGFARNAVCIYKPLLENLKIIS